MQGFNMGRYYPPDASHPPSFNATCHPLGKRASKISQGILTVRFELPFAVWCSHCTPPAIIGQGVRFNAQKKKVGNYYSTPIWSFRMKHSACGGWWEIRTDPQNTQYVVTEGARRRDYGPGEGEGEKDGELKFLTEEEREKRRSDAFANFESKMDEKGEERKHRERIEELYDKTDVWRDPYDVNARLRKDFRAKRRTWKKEEKHKEDMQEKFGLRMKIVDETETDRQRASLIEFGGNDERKTESRWTPLFAEKRMEKKVVEGVPSARRLKCEIAAEKSRLWLQDTLVGNTRAAMDPFVAKDGYSLSSTSFSALKRKRDAISDEDMYVAATLTMDSTQEMTSGDELTKKAVLPRILVGYDSE